MTTSVTSSIIASSHSKPTILVAIASSTRPQKLAPVKRIGAIPFALLPFTQTPISESAARTRASRKKPELGQTQTRNSKIASDSRTIKHRKQSECVSLFKRQIHDFPFSSGRSLHNVLLLTFSMMIPSGLFGCWRKSSTRLARSFVWSMSQLCFGSFPHTLPCVRVPSHDKRATQKIAARTITVDGKNLCAKLEIKIRSFSLESEKENEKCLCNKWRTGSSSAGFARTAERMQFASPWFWKPSLDGPHK